MLLLVVQLTEKYSVRRQLTDKKIHFFCFWFSVDYYERRNDTSMQIVNCTSRFDDRNCRSGLVYNYQTMRMISAFGPVITGSLRKNIFHFEEKVHCFFLLAGIFAATLSSALASLVGAPKIFQAVCRDMIFPRLKYFSVGNGKSDEPIRAYFLTYFVAVSFTAIGEKKNCSKNSV